MPRQPKPCNADQIRNPATGRCVKRSGKIGKKIAPISRSKSPLKSRSKSPLKSSGKKCRDDQIRNPATGRCVKRSGKIGKQLVRPKSKSRSASKSRSRSRSRSPSYNGESEWVYKINEKIWLDPLDTDLTSAFEENTGMGKWPVPQRYKEPGKQTMYFLYKFTPKQASALVSIIKRVAPSYLKNNNWAPRSHYEKYLVPKNLITAEQAKKIFIRFMMTDLIQPE